MLRHHGGDVVDIEVRSSAVTFEREENADDPDGQPMHKRIAAESPYKAKFKSILTTYDDERMWWVAVENLMKLSEDFAAKVNFCILACTAHFVVYLISYIRCSHAGGSEVAG